jgi:predicted flavoprotein YhiN
MEEKVIEPLTTKTPQEIEAELIKQVQDEAIHQAANMKPEERAAMTFSQGFPVFEQLVSDLSNKDLRRLCEALVQFPLITNDPKFNEEKARHALGVGLNLIDAKYIMRMAVNIEQQLEAQDQAQQQDANEQTNGEANNG